MNYSIALIIFFVSTSSAMNKDEYIDTLTYRKKFDVSLPDVHEPVVPRVELPDCAICLGIVDGMELAPCTMLCGHKFHFDCVKEWIDKNSTCPLCRGNDGGSVQVAERRLARSNPRSEVVNTLVSHTIIHVADMLCIPAGLRRRVMSENP
jgi:hypothetical protein